MTSQELLDIESIDEPKWSGNDLLEEAADKLNMVGDYLLGQVLGKGSQGRVYKALHVKTGKFVAVKELIFDGDSQEKTKQATKEEIKMLSEICHPNIIKYNDVIKKNGNIYIILEYIESGSIKDILHRFGNFPEPLAAVYVKQILEGIEYLHSKNIMHRDIKGGNILITKDGVCKLADFGLARTNTTSLSSIGPAGTTYWMAPELFDTEMGKIGPPSDIWSLGATIVEIITGTPPFQSLGPLAAIYQIAEGDTSPIPIGISEELSSFLEGCFTRSPKKRKTATELLQHPWITGETISAHTIKQSGNYGTLVKALKDYRASGEAKNISINSGSFGLIRRLSVRNKQKLKRRDIASVFGPQDEDSEQTSTGTVLSPRSQTQKNIQTLLGEILDNASSDLPNLCTKLSHQFEDILQSNTQLEQELTLANQETEQLAKLCTRATEDIDHLNRRNHYLREKIQFLEANINTSDYDMARILYEDEISWHSFPPTVKRGVLKIYLKGKWKKRLVALRDNFMFLFRSENEQPSEIIKLVDVVVSSDHRKLPANSFCVKTSSKQGNWLFCAANFSIMTQWMQALTFTKPWYEEVDPVQLETKELSTQNEHRNPKITTKSRSKTSNAIALAKNRFRKYSAGGQ